MFALVNAKGGSKERQSPAGPRSPLRFRDPGGSWTHVHQRPRYDREGLPKGRGVYVVATHARHPGIWRVEAQAHGQKVPVHHPGERSPGTVVPGMAAPR